MPALLQPVGDTARTSLRARAGVFAALLTAECLGLAYAPHAWLPMQHPAATPIVFVAALLFFGRERLRPVALAVGRVSRRFLFLHLFALAICIGLSLALLRVVPGTAAFVVATALLLASVLLGVASLLCGLFAPEQVAEAARRLGWVWVVAAVCAVLTMVSRTLVQLAWNAPDSRFGQALTGATFRGVESILGLFYADVVADPGRSVLGTTRFVVEVQGVCSGMESLSLILVLTVGWLVYARRELRMARAVWLVPVALGLMWLLNLVRIAALIAIGTSGHSTLAVTGFHAEAGWILFNCVALGFLVTAQRLPWLRRAGVEVLEAVPSWETNQAAVYLLPFLAIVAASLITQAVSSGFEWLYPLRFVAALGVLWKFRAHYRRMDWRFGWVGLVAGVGVFAVWVGMDRGAASAPTALGANLAALPVFERLVWVGFRVLAAVVTVPVAEELAFRGFVARRLVDADVEAVSYGRLPVTSILVSSAAFGLMHGRMAVAGFLAGLVFALVAKARNRLGEAVAAHVTANLLLAGWVLLRGDYGLW